MPMPRTNARLIAEELCKKFPDHSNLGLAKRLKAEHPESFSSVEQARSMVRLIRGARGKYHKQFATQPRPKGKAGTVAKMPPSVAEEWKPFVVGNGVSVGIISDCHIPYHCEVALEASVRNLKKRKPDVLLINGDFADFYQVSRHQRDPKNRRFSEELKLVKQGLEWLKQEFSKSRIVYKFGNHEERWNHFIWNRAPEIYDVAGVQIEELLGLKQLGIEHVGDSPVMLGKLPVMHGHELGKSIFSPVNPARGAFLRTHHTVLVSHSHQTSGHADTNLFHEETFVWSIGCLCDLTPAYARVNRWNHGYGFVEVASDGSFNVSNLRISKAGEVRSA